MLEVSFIFLKVDSLVQKLDKTDSEVKKETQKNDKTENGKHGKLKASKTIRKRKLKVKEEKKSNS